MRIIPHVPLGHPNANGKNGHPVDSPQFHTFRELDRYVNGKRTMEGIQECVTILQRNLSLLREIRGIDFVLREMRQFLAAQHRESVNDSVVWSHKFDQSLGPIRFSADGKVLAAADKRGIITLFKSNSGVELEIVKLDSGYPTCMAFSPSGKELAIGTGSGFVDLFDITHLQGNGYLEYRASHPVKGGVNALAYSGDGKILAAACINECVCCLNLQTEASEPILFGDLPGEPTSVALDEKGKALAVGFQPFDSPRHLTDPYAPVNLGELHIYKTETREDVVPPVPFNQAVNDVAFLPGGNSVICISGSKVHKISRSNVGEISSSLDFGTTLYHLAGRRTIVTAAGPNIYFLRSDLGVLDIQSLEISTHIHSFSYYPHKLAVTTPIAGYNDEGSPPKELYVYRPVLHGKKSATAAR